MSAIGIPTLDIQTTNDIRGLQANPVGESMNPQRWPGWVFDPLAGSGQAIILSIDNRNTTNLILDSNLSFKADFDCNKLGQLSELQGTLRQVAVSINKNLQSVDSMFEKYSSAAPIPQFTDPQSWCSGIIGTQPNFLSPSLHLPYSQSLPYFGSNLEFVCDFFSTLLRQASTQLRRTLGRVENAICRIDDSVTMILRELARSCTGLFCSMRWERRRWFVRHGARPPKKTVQVIFSLFTEACSSC